MAPESGSTHRPLRKVFLDEPYRFGFFQAVRLLERMYSSRKTIGLEGPPREEVVRFHSRVTLEFPASEVYEINGPPSNGEEAPVDMVVTFMGMAGTVGVLPAPYTELLLERIRYKDTALRDFLDLFNHRMVSIFYRAWEKFYFSIAYERDHQNPFTELLFNLVGMGTGGLRDRLGLSDESLLYYGGLVAQKPCSASALEAIVADQFGVPVNANQFSPQWLDIDEGSLTHLGAANSELGLNAIVGFRILDFQSKFRLRLGPLSYEQFLDFLPNGTAFPPATKLIRFLAGIEFDFDLQLVLKAIEVPACQLRTQGLGGPLLGWTTWLKSLPLKLDDPQLVLAVKA